jgi:cell division protein FtsZ
MNTPGVWRSGRTSAAKVDALVSNGMDEIEIPAFLRKQAD